MLGVLWRNVILNDKFCYFISYLQFYIDRLEYWCFLNKLQISLAKCSVLHLFNNKTKTYFFDGCEIPSNLASIRNLGYNVAPSLKPNIHIDITIKKAKACFFILLIFTKTPNSAIQNQCLLLAKM